MTVKGDERNVGYWEGLTRGQPFSAFTVMKAIDPCCSLNQQFLERFSLKLALIAPSSMVAFRINVSLSLSSLSIDTQKIS